VVDPRPADRVRSPEEGWREPDGNGAPDANAGAVPVRGDIPAITSKRSPEEFRTGGGPGLVEWRQATQT